MGLFDSVFDSLPKITGSLVQDKLINYAQAPVKQLINESYTNVSSKFLSVGSVFSKLNVGAPTFSELGIGSALGSIGGIGSVFGSGLDPAYSDIADSVIKSFGFDSDGNVSATEINASGASANSNDDSHKIKLISSVNRSEIIAFDVMPTISEQRNIEYSPISILQAPTEFQKYKNTKNTTWQITAKFVSRNISEASQNYINLLLLRTWSMPFFGRKTPSAYLGAPPPIIYFSGYRGLVGKVPTVITSLSWSFPDECDWIPTDFQDQTSGKAIPFPVILTVQINLTESYSPNEINSFDRELFNNGMYEGAFAGDVPDPSEAQTTDAFDLSSIISNVLGGVNPGSMSSAEVDNENTRLKNRSEAQQNTSPAVRSGTDAVNLPDLGTIGDTSYDALGNRIF